MHRNRIATLTLTGPDIDTDTATAALLDISDRIVDDLEDTEVHTDTIRGTATIIYHDDDLDMPIMALADRVLLPAGLTATVTLHWSYRLGAGDPFGDLTSD